MGKTLLNLPESYSFRANEKTSARVFRYAYGTKLEFLKLVYQKSAQFDNTIDLSNKDISINIGEADPKKKRKQKHVGILTNFDDMLTIEIGFEEKKFNELLKSIDNNTDPKNLYNLSFCIDINKKEIKKKTSADPKVPGFDYYLIDSFVMVKTIDNK